RINRRKTRLGTLVSGSLTCPLSEFLLTRVTPHTGQMNALRRRRSLHDFLGRERVNRTLQLFWHPIQILCSPIFIAEEIPTLSETRQQFSSGMLAAIGKIA